MPRNSFLPAWIERSQVFLYLFALAVGAVAGIWLPEASTRVQWAINPGIALLLYCTFLGIPFMKVRRAGTDFRFLSAVLILNFGVVPLIVWPLSRLVAHEKALLVGVLCVLLTPCVDYVIVFTGLAGGAQERLLTASPVLMIGQIILLPVYLWLFEGDALIRVIDFIPLGKAFIFLIVFPLLAALLTQFFAERNSIIRNAKNAMQDAMVLVMMALLIVVVAVHVAAVGNQAGQLLPVIPVFVLFVTIMVPLGTVTGRASRLDAEAQRAIVFSGVTRNSLVILPLVMALPPAFALSPLVVVLQTLVELVAMVVMVKLIPRLIRPNKGPLAL